MTRTLALLTAVSALALAAASTAGAGSPAVCKPFKLGRTTYKSETIGTHWTCSSAKPWIVKLIADRVSVSTKNVPLKNGPRGYHCFAQVGSKGGHATSGTCYTGTLAFPGTGFAWFNA